MATPHLQQRIGYLIFATSSAVALVNLIGNLVRHSGSELWFGLVTNSLLLVVIGAFALFITRIDSKLSRLAIFLIFLLPAGPATTGGATSFFGLWMFLIAIVLAFKLDIAPRKVWLILGAGAYFLPWLYFLVVMESNDHLRIDRLANYGVFLLFCTLSLYFIFEEEIRDLLAANKRKDVEIAEREAEIARLEPLSTLGQRVAHVAHSFKNNLSLLSTAQVHLEQGGDTERALQKLQEFSRSINERIDNILMVSRAGADQSEEVFDAARVLAGLNQVYLTEPAFLQRAKVEVEALEATPVMAVRWDFLLMVENILKNALEALTTKGGYGNIRVTLAGRVLTIANDGGAMPLCHDCHNDCLKCSLYGRPGQTTKPGGSGHGLAQVFATCRQYHWTCRIRTHEEWTIFEIGLPRSDA